MYIFYGQPNMLVKSRKKVLFQNTVQFKPLFRFNENGEYETNDEQLIKKLISRFDHKVMEDTLKNIEAIEEKEVKKITCKKCGQQFENIGKLMNHSRIEHK